MSKKKTRPDLIGPLVTGAGWSSCIIQDNPARRGRRAGARVEVLHRITLAPTASRAAIPGGNDAFPPGATTPDACKTPAQVGDAAAGSKPPLGGPAAGSDPDPAAVVDVAASLSDITSIAAMQTGDDAVIVGFDTEYVDNGSGRLILSYQLVVPDPRNPEQLHEFVFLVRPGKRLRLTTALRHIIETAELYADPSSPAGFTRGGVPERAIRAWSAHKKSGTRKTFTSLDAAIAYSDFPAERAGLAASRTQRSNGRYDYQRRSGEHPDNKRGTGCGYESSDTELFKRALPLVLVAHFAKADIGTFDLTGAEPDLVRHCTEVGGGLVSLNPIRVRVALHGLKHPRTYPVLLDIRDTKAHAPAGKASLADLGEVVNVPKLPTPGDYITRMDEYLADHPLQFLEYAINDAVIALLYPAALYGAGKSFGVSLPSLAAKVAAKTMGGYFEVRRSGDFKREYAGMVPIEAGLSEIERDNLHGYIREVGLQPLDLWVKTYQDAAAYAYRGGLNGCLGVGLYLFPTFDLDLENAYPTAMCLVPDVDWAHPDGCIQQVIERRDLTISDLADGPLTPLMGQVTFEFPSDIVMPSFAVPYAGSVVYPRTSDGMNAVYASGPEIWLALVLGARVHCELGFIARIRYEDAEAPGVPVPSRALRHAVKQLVSDRTTAKNIWGKGSLPDLMCKIAVNSLYGKTAQDVSPHSSWQALDQEMKEIGGSVITSPHHATMTTALVRTVLVATINQLHGFGYTVYSVTTDGFITDAPESVVQGLDLYGLAEPFREARVFLADDPSMWAVKHQQSDLLNFTTRGNVSLEPGGVLAHAGFRSSYPEDSDADRREFRHVIASRTGRTSNDFIRPLTFKEMSLADLGKRKDFTMIEVSREMGFDFDLKREPIEATMTADTVPSEGEVFEVAHLDTRPWSSVVEYARAKQIGRDMTCLRTLAEWQTFFLRLRNGKQAGRYISDAGRARMMSLVLGHRLGMWEIPNLADPGTTVAEKVAWVNAWGMSPKPFTLSDWKNARRPERQTQVLPAADLEPWLTRWIEAPLGITPHPMPDLFSDHALDLTTADYNAQLEAELDAYLDAEIDAQVELYVALRRLDEDLAEWEITAYFEEHVTDKAHRVEHVRRRRLGEPCDCGAPGATDPVPPEHIAYSRSLDAEVTTARQALDALYGK